MSSEAFRVSSDPKAWFGLSVFDPLEADFAKHITNNRIRRLRHGDFEDTSSGSGPDVGLVDSSTSENNEDVNSENSDGDNCFDMQAFSTFHQQLRKTQQAKIRRNEGTASTSARWGRKHRGAPS